MERHVRANAVQPIKSGSCIAPPFKLETGDIELTLAGQGAIETLGAGHGAQRAEEVCAVEGCRGRG